MINNDHTTDQKNSTVFTDLSIRKTQPEFLPRNTQSVTP